MTTNGRQQAATIGEVVEALTTAPYVTELSEYAQPHRAGRRRIHPPWVVFAYAALTRHFRSANHTDSELASGLWQTMRTAAVDNGLDDPGDKPYAYPHFTYQRHQIISDTETRTALAETFTTVAIGQARSLGLLKPKGGGSLTYPHPTRTIYGDGTILRPIYRHPKPHTTRTDETTGEDIPLYPKTSQKKPPQERNPPVQPRRHHPLRQRNHHHLAVTTRQPRTHSTRPTRRPPLHHPLQPPQRRRKPQLPVQAKPPRRPRHLSRMGTPTLRPPRLRHPPQQPGMAVTVNLELEVV